MDIMRKRDEQSQTNNDRKKVGRKTDRDKEIEE